jgi:hypothetical protein
VRGDQGYRLMNGEGVTTLPFPGRRVPGTNRGTHRSASEVNHARVCDFAASLGGNFHSGVPQPGSTGSGGCRSPLLDARPDSEIEPQECLGCRT